VLASFSRDVGIFTRGGSEKFHFSAQKFLPPTLDQINFVAAVDIPRPVVRASAGAGATAVGGVRRGPRRKRYPKCAQTPIYFALNRPPLPPLRCGNMAAPSLRGLDRLISVIAPGCSAQAHTAFVPALARGWTSESCALCLELKTCHRHGYLRL
jgi:hypothetical protein